MTNLLIQNYYHLQKKDTEEGLELYVGSEVLKKIGAPKERIKRPSVEGYRVFVQSTGLGARHISAGSFLLYEVLYFCSDS